jgi:hypothetical protein
VAPTTCRYSRIFAKIPGQKMTRKLLIYDQKHRNSQIISEFWPKMTKKQGFLMDFTEIQYFKKYAIFIVF